VDIVVVSLVYLYITFKNTRWPKCFPLKQYSKKYKKH